MISGVHHGAEKLLLKCAWSPDQDFVTAGSADRYKAHDRMHDCIIVVAAIPPA